MKMLSLFSGIGGMDLAAHWAGIETVGFVEIDPFCQKVLAKHWPNVPIFNDVRKLTAQSLRRAGIDPESISVVAGGFPCQDISNANPTGRGLGGERSGLWGEMRRIVRELRPVWVVAENVSNLRARGVDEVLAALEEDGYAARPLWVDAATLGSVAYRDRCFVVAYASREPALQASAKTLPVGGQRETWHHVVRRPRGSESAIHWTLSEADVYRTPDEFSGGMDAYRAATTALGNAVNPEHVFPIFKTIAVHN